MGANVRFSPHVRRQFGSPTSAHTVDSTDFNCSAESRALKSFQFKGATLQPPVTAFKWGSFPFGRLLALCSAQGWQARRVRGLLLSCCFPSSAGFRFLSFYFTRGLWSTLFSHRSFSPVGVSDLGLLFALRGARQDANKEKELPKPESKEILIDGKTERSPSSLRLLCLLF